MVQLLLYKDSNPESECSDGWTPLTTAAYNAVDAKIVQLLLAHGADPLKRNRGDDGWKPLQWAEYHGGPLS